LVVEGLLHQQVLVNQAALEAIQVFQRLHQLEVDLVEETNQLVVAPTEDPEAVVMVVVHHKMAE
jgi:hypothetical protein